MNGTTKGLRLHIGVFGRRNVGKSSIVNALTGQQVSIVSDVPGTTTDPVDKTMELKPIGPVVFIDTAGTDDKGQLGGQRVARTVKAMERTELALLVTDDWTDEEDRLVRMLEQRKTPYIVVANKKDMRMDDSLEAAAVRAGAKYVATTCAVFPEGFDRLRQLMVEAAPVEFLEARPLLADLVRPGDTVLLVTPLDIEAPKGRLKMLQVHCLREILDRGATAVIVKETELEAALAGLIGGPSLVVADSQVFDKVAAQLDPETPATTFSIVMARFKGDLEAMAAAAEVIDTLRPGDRVLVAESCTHHPIGEDIGRVQIPALLEQAAGGPLKVDIAAGQDYPQDLRPYRLVVHCGACVFNRKQMLWRIHQAQSQGVPITNYGVAITHCMGLLDRATAPLTAAQPLTTAG